MKAKPTYEDFAAIASHFGKPYRYYSGRWRFRGHGVTVDNFGVLTPLAAALAADPACAALARIEPHCDDMGKQVVAAWAIHHFAPED